MKLLDKYFQATLLLVFLGILGSVFASEGEESPEDYGETLQKNFTSENGTKGSRIVGGTRARIGEFPYQLSMRVNLGGGRYIMCGASIISPFFAVSAAHCVDVTNLRASQVTLRSGSVRWWDGPGTQHTVLQVLKHPRWNSKTVDYDVALIKVLYAFSFGPTVGAVRLPSAGYEAPHGTLALASGWGAVSENGGSSDDLLYISTPMAGMSQCRQVNGNAITNSMVCAGLIRGKGTCYGDSGGPLVIRGVLVGITSFGLSDCASSWTYDVYAKVSNPDILSWITSYIN